jgi:hypothetical protein
MHRLWTLSRFVLPALAIAAFVGRFKWGTGLGGFSSGN